MAYRSQKEERPVERASVGIVADMVRQFADPYAFLRELVQNGIDAGATALEVGVGWDPSGEVTVSVADDGTGMDRATIEGPLLTLFASAKDGDDSKIGKYGVGFVSVFALAPRRVVVETWRADAAYRLTLFPDHRYELEEVEVAAASERSASGTVIAVQVEAGEAELPAFAARAEEALARWCSHARVPIFLSVTMGRETQRARIDRPLALPAVVTIHETDDDFEIVVGPARGSRHYGSDDGFFAGFYNRGLTLHTTRYPPRASLSHLQFKVDSPRLQHTLSRDDVRHDAAYHRVLERVAKIGEGVLRERIRTELEQAALDKDPRRYAALLSAAVWEPPQTIVLPLCDPLARAMVLSLTDVVVDGRILWSDKPSSLTAALAAAGIPVVHAVHAEVPLLIDGIVKATVARAGQVYVLAVERDDPTEHARAWTKLVGEALRVAGMEVGRVALCRLFDRGASPASRVVDQPGPRHTLLREGGERLGAWLQRDLLLDEGDPAVQAAFRLAGTSARESAALLARYILAESQGQVSAAQSDQLSAFAIGEAP